MFHRLILIIIYSRVDFTLSLKIILLCPERYGKPFWKNLKPRYRYNELFQVGIPRHYCTNMIWCAALAKMHTLYHSVELRNIFSCTFGDIN